MSKQKVKLNDVNFDTIIIAGIASIIKMRLLEKSLMNGFFLTAFFKKIKNVYIYFECCYFNGSAKSVE